MTWKLYTERVQQSATTESKSLFCFTSDTWQLLAESISPANSIRVARHAARIYNHTLTNLDIDVWCGHANHPHTYTHSCYIKHVRLAYCALTAFIHQSYQCCRGVFYGDYNRAGEVDSSGTTQAVSTLQGCGHDTRSQHWAVQIVTTITTNTLQMSHAWCLIRHS